MVDQIKEALLSVEEDEADFKNVANALHGLFTSLKESKADKSEMAQLRNQLITAQLNGGSSSSSNEGILDYKGLRKILASYSKTEVIDKKLDNKAGKDLTFQRLDHSEQMIDKILKTIDELWNVITNTSLIDVKDTQFPNITASPNAKNSNTSRTECDAEGICETAPVTLSSMESNVLSRSSLFASNREKKSRFSIKYRLSRPSTVTSSPLKEMQQLAPDTRRGTSIAGSVNRPYTSPVGTSRLRSMTNLRPYRKSVVPSSRHLPAIESKSFVEDDGGNLFVGNSNSENKSINRDSVELSARRFSSMSFRDGKASST